MKLDRFTQKEANYQQHLKDQHDGNLATAFN